ncbi:MAG: orotidine-5'-phosphate decarboxylase, partial [Elusimicrobiota bacterium]
MTQVIVALDVDTIKREEDLLRQLKDAIVWYKVGLRLFTAHGKRAVDLVRRHGGNIFLDLKLHDIPSTVRGAATSAAAMGVALLTVHGYGGAPMVQAAVEGAGSATGILVVTVLTSHEENDMADLGLPRDIGAQVERLAQLAQNCRLDGVVCSPREVERLRQ